MLPNFSLCFWQLSFPFLRFTFKYAFKLFFFPNILCAWIQKVIGWNFASLKAAILTESLSTIFPNLQFWHHLFFFIYTQKVSWNVKLIVHFGKEMFTLILDILYFNYLLYDLNFLLNISCFSKSFVVVYIVSIYYL